MDHVQRFAMQDNLHLSVFAVGWRWCNPPGPNTSEVPGRKSAAIDAHKQGSQTSVIKVITPHTHEVKSGVKQLVHVLPSVSLISLSLSVYDEGITYLN